MFVALFAVLAAFPALTAPQPPGNIVLCPEVGDPSTHPNWGLLEHDLCGDSASDRIIGGDNATLGEYPWMARVGYAGPDLPGVSYRCGGAVLNQNTIITAAHCVTGLPNGIKVVAVQVGEHNTETDPDCEKNICAEPVQTFKPKFILIHAGYNQVPFKHDIALIRLQNNITLHTYVTPICFIRGSLLRRNLMGSKVEVAGWGIYDIENPKNSKVLQKVHLKIQENDLCQEQYKKHAPIGPTQMCVGGEVNKDSCGGDSGGPLMQVATEDGDSSYKVYMIGVVSFGSKKCGASTMAGIYTRLSCYVHWVLDNLIVPSVQSKLI